MPSAAAACHSRSPRPGWSAAASNSSVCVSVGQFPHAPHEQVFELVTDGQRLGQRRLVRRSCSGVSSRGGLDDGQRIATGLGDDALRHVRVDRSADRAREQVVRVLLRQAGEPKTRQRLQARVRLRGLPDREQHPDPVGQQPARHEAEDLGGLVVQPLRVVDHAQHRPVLGGVREQREHGQADQERIGRRPAHQPERHAERPPLRLGQPVHAGRRGRSSWWTAAKPRLVSDSTATIRTICRSAACSHCVVEQRGLPDPGLTPEDQRAAHADCGRCRAARRSACFSARRSINRTRRP